MKTVMPGIDAVTVVIPARDEETALPGCLTAMRRAANELHAAHPEVPVDVVVVLDRCVDASGTVARAHGARTIEVSAGNVGRARASGFVQAIGEHTKRGRYPDSLWIATTDADSTVPPHWLTSQLQLALGGADALVGTVMPDVGLERGLRAEWVRRHTLADGHPHIHGANLGVRASAYTAVGGFGALSVHEDADLVARLRAAPGITVVATDAHRVITSSRLDPRITGGFGSYLRTLGAEAPA